MKRTRMFTLLCLVAGIANAQQNLRGSDSLALYTRGLITDLGLTGQLRYLGAGSTVGIADAIDAQFTGQTVSPSSRAVNTDEVNAAAARSLYFVDYVLGLDGIVITVNDVGNASVSGIRFSDLRHIYRCEWTNWTSVPNSTRTDDILAMALDENSGITDFFQSSVGGFYTLPPDNWWAANYPCVNICRGDGCTQIIGRTTAEIPNAIGFTGAPGLAPGNRDLLISNDNTNPPTPLLRFSEATVRDQSYQLAHQLHMYHVIGAYNPYGAQAALLAGAQNCACNCPRLAAHGFFSVRADYCPFCTATCPP